MCHAPTATMRVHWMAGTGRITAFAVTRGAGRGVAARLDAVPLLGAVAAPPVVPEVEDAETTEGRVDVGEVGSSAVG